MPDKIYSFHLNPQSFKHWAVTLSIAIPLLLGTASQGWDIIKYDILKQPRNDEEILIRHMFDEHFNEDDKVEQSINADYAKITTWFYPSDECVIIRRMDMRGQVIGTKILPKDIEAIKKQYASLPSLPPIPKEAFAAQLAFNFRRHKGDFNFKERSKRDGYSVIITRYYSDGCRLQYKLDAYGNACCWKWLKQVPH